ncbi:MAG: site-2 protease family protein [Actinomycetota bacterium]
MIADLDLVAGLGVALGFVIGIVAHHWAHARMAIALGDKTPRLMGRATLKIKPHVDTLGSIILPIVFVIVAIFSHPAMMFGWGKAQSFNPRALRKPRRDMILIALAGPAATTIVTAVAAAVSRIELGNNIGLIFGYMALVTSFLTVIELLPIPGRDGGRILVRFLSPSAAMRFEELTQYDVLFLLVLFLFLEPVVLRMVDTFQSLIGA